MSDRSIPHPPYTGKIVKFPGARYAFDAPDVMPIEIRPGYFVYIQGIPRDLTKNEASKIAKVIEALGEPPPRTGDAE